MTELRGDLLAPPRRGGWPVLALCTLLLLAMFAAALCLGLTSFSPADTFQALLGTHSDADTILIIRELRLPRVVLALRSAGRCRWRGCSCKQSLGTL